MIIFSISFQFYWMSPKRQIEMTVYTIKQEDLSKLQQEILLLKKKNQLTIKKKNINSEILFSIRPPAHLFASQVLQSQLSIPA